MTWYFATWWQKTLRGLNEGNIQMWNTLTDIHPFHILRTRKKEIRERDIYEHVVLIGFQVVNNKEAKIIKEDFQ